MRALRALGVFAGGALLATQAHAYHFFQNTNFDPHRWQSLPVLFQVDQGPTDIQSELATAAVEWNSVPTAREVLSTAAAVDGGGNPLDFDATNYGTAWGILSGDGQQEVVFDEDGSALMLLGLDPASINGYGPSRKTTVGGTAVIDDAFLIINGSRTNFDRQSTEVHELGHTLGLAHSSVGMFNSSAAPSDALEVVAVGSVPTMHPFSVGGTARRSTEADDRAAISLLYPEASFFTSLGTIAGTVTRCGTSPREPLTGVNVRAVQVGNAAVQVTRYTGFDGNDEGRFSIVGLPPGSYHVIVEPMGSNGFVASRMAIATEMDRDFSTEYHSTDECPEELPDSARAVAVTGGGTSAASVEVGGVRFALVVDDTGSMSEEIGAVRQTLNNFIDLVDAIPFLEFPTTAIVTFKDDVTKRIVSDDPDELRAVVNALTADGGDDCPESSNAALLAAGRMLRPLGVALLFTDADSRPDGPGRAAVLSEYRSRGILLSTLLSGACTTPGGSPAAIPSENEGQHLVHVGTGGAGPRETCWTQSSLPGAAAEEYPPPEVLGFESAIETYASFAAGTGGFFAFDAAVSAAYINAASNIAAASVVPAVGQVSPGKAPSGTTVNLLLRGGNTNFRSGSLVSLSHPALEVLQTTVQSPTEILISLRIPGAQPLGFYDVEVTTDLGPGTTEIAEGRGAFEVVAPSGGPEITSMVPPEGVQGTTIHGLLTVTGLSLGSPTPTLDFGPDINVQNVTVASSSSLSFDLLIGAGATPGFRSAILAAGSQVVSLPQAFLIVEQLPSVPAVVAVDPAQARQGDTVILTITGANTLFQDSSSVVSFSGSGLVATTPLVTSSTEVVVEVTLAPDAEPGFRDVFVTTGGEVATGLNAFEVLARGTGGSMLEVPALSDLGLVLLALLLAIGGVWFVRTGHRP